MCLTIARRNPRRAIVVLVPGAGAGAVSAPAAPLACADADAAAAAPPDGCCFGGSPGDVAGQPPVPSKNALARCTSSFVTRPPSPDPSSELMSTPASRAACRTAGDARATRRPPGGGALPVACVVVIGGGGMAGGTDSAA
eukprot:366412-Chlamydomonas_euryale.AAC.1